MMIVGLHPLRICLDSGAKLIEISNLHIIPKREEKSLIIGELLDESCKIITNYENILENFYKRLSTNAPKRLIEIQVSSEMQS